MDKLLQMGRTLEGVLTSNQTWHSVWQQVKNMVQNLGLYFILLPVWCFVVLIFLVWSCVCWGIISLYMTMGIFRKSYLKMIYIPPIKNYSDYPHVLKLKLLFMLTYMVGEIKGSLKSLKSILAKPK